MIATGTNLATAAPITTDLNHVTTAAAGTGVALPLGQPGMDLVIFNDGANTIKVYANGSDTIDAVAGATGVSLSATRRCRYICFATNVWISAQLGVVSA